MKSSEKKAKKIGFSLHAPQARRVSLAGDFNDWDPISYSMKKDNKGAWKISINLFPGTYQYRFFVDGEWQNDPSCSSFVENTFGTSNCLKMINIGRRDTF